MGFIHSNYSCLKVWHLVLIFLCSHYSQWKEKRYCQNLIYDFSDKSTTSFCEGLHLSSLSSKSLENYQPLEANFWMARIRCDELEWHLKLLKNHIADTSKPSLHEWGTRHWYWNWLLPPRLSFIFVKKIPFSQYWKMTRKWKIMKKTVGWHECK